MRGGEGSLRELADITGVGKTTISEMRKVKDHLHARGEEAASMAQRGWEACYRVVKGYGGVDCQQDNQGDATVSLWAERLWKQFGHAARKHPQLFAKALMMFNPELVTEMIRTEDWAELKEEAERRDLEETDEDALEGEDY